jgi:hypothetical protein
VRAPIEVKSRGKKSRENKAEEDKTSRSGDPNVIEISVDTSDMPVVGKPSESAKEEITILVGRDPVALIPEEEKKVALTAQPKEPWPMEPNLRRSGLFEISQIGGKFGMVNLREEIRRNLSTPAHVIEKRKEQQIMNLKERTSPSTSAPTAKRPEQPRRIIPTTIERHNSTIENLANKSQEEHCTIAVHQNLPPVTTLLSMPDVNSIFQLQPSPPQVQPPVLATINIGDIQPSTSSPSGTSVRKKTPRKTKHQPKIDPEDPLKETAEALLKLASSASNEAPSMPVAESKDQETSLGSSDSLIHWAIHMANRTPEAPAANKCNKKDILSPEEITSIRHKRRKKKSLSPVKGQSQPSMSTSPSSSAKEQSKSSLPLHPEVTAMEERMIAEAATAAKFLSDVSDHIESDKKCVHFKDPVVSHSLSSEEAQCSDILMSLLNAGSSAIDELPAKEISPHKSPAKSVFLAKCIQAGLSGPVPKSILKSPSFKAASPRTGGTQSKTSGMKEKQARSSSTKVR